VNLDIESARHSMLQDEHSNDYTPLILRDSAGHRSTDFSTLEDSCSDCFTTGISTLPDLGLKLI
jgi:hypothetical protein